MLLTLNRDLTIQIDSTDWRATVNGTRKCSIEGCDASGKIRLGMCEKHYRRALRQRPTAPVPIDPPEVRLKNGMVLTSAGCLEWMRCRDKRGYGTISINGKNRQTHRVAWELANGPIPDGLFVCHRCDNPPCGNVEHLFLGTAQDNVDDMWAKGRGAGTRRVKHN